MAKIKINSCNVVMMCSSFDALIAHKSTSAQQRTKENREIINACLEFCTGTLYSVNCIQARTWKKKPTATVNSELRVANRNLNIYEQFSYLLFCDLSLRDKCVLSLRLTVILLSKNRKQFHLHLPLIICSLRNSIFALKFIRSEFAVIKFSLMMSIKIKGWKMNRKRLWISGRQKISEIHDDNERWHNLDPHLCAGALNEAHFIRWMQNRQNVQPTKRHDEKTRCREMRNESRKKN